MGDFLLYLYFGVGVLLTSWAIWRYWRLDSESLLSQGAAEWKLAGIGLVLLVVLWPFWILRAWEAGL